MELSAVVFPDTVLSEKMCIPLVPVFAPLVYLQPVENDPEPLLPRSVLCEELLRQSLCRVRVPAPLSEDRDRFLRLVRDLRFRGDEYAAQLGHLVLSGIPAASGKATETESTIVGSLLSGGGIRDAAGDHRKMLLWQSRLLLKLAEVHAAEREELCRQIGAIREKEKRFFTNLRDDEENLFALPSDLELAGMDAAAMRQQRKAWTRLLVLGGAGGGDTPRVVLSLDRDGMDLLAEGFEKRTGQAPVPLGQLALPAGCGDQANFAERVGRFREEGATLLARIGERLAGQAEPKPTGCLFAEGNEAWADLLEEFFPAAQWGRVRLALSSCPGSTVQQLFADTFAPEEAKFLPEPASGPGKAVVLGVLEEK